MKDQGHLIRNPILNDINDINKQPKPIWVDYKYGKNAGCGKVLLSFFLID
jgi:hypothetical protein